MGDQQTKPSRRALRLWQRLTESYGSRFVQSFGEHPGREWCRLADQSGDQELRKALDLLRKRHPSHPPTLMEFEALVKAPRRTEQREQTMQELLEAHVYRTRTLTPRQLVRWRWLYAGKPWGEDARVTGVVIPADGNAPEHLVTVAEMERAPA